MDLPQLIKKISTLSKKTKTPIYAVGGFVRDYLMGVAFKKDIDFVVDGSGLAFAQQLDNILKQAGSLVEFPEFDTARYVIKVKSRKLKVESEIEDGGELMEIEFAGARAESYDEKSRKPKVSPTNLDEDLKRRDFTVNTLAIAVADLVKLLPARSKAGDLLSLKKLTTRQLDKIVIDHLGGHEDLENKILRTPLAPDATFSDDPLRMMRAIRFAGQLDFGIAPEALESIHRQRERLKIISAERIQEELLKMLACPRPSVCLALMFQTHLLDLVLPEVAQLDGVEEVYGHQHKNNMVHTFKVVDNIAERSDKVWLRLAGLLHDIGKTQTKRFFPKIGWTFHQHEHLGKKMVFRIARRLRWSKELGEYVAKLVRWHQQPISLMDEGITDSAVRRLIVSLGDELEDLLILGASDITTGNPFKLQKRQNNYLRLRQRIDEVIDKDKLRAFQSPVRGEEIMRDCALKPGPTVGKIKEAIEEAILDGKILNEYEPAREYFLKIKDQFLKQAESWEVDSKINHEA